MPAVMVLKDVTGIRQHPHWVFFAVSGPAMMQDMLGTHPLRGLSHASCGIFQEGLAGVGWSMQLTCIDQSSCGLKLLVGDVISRHPACAAPIWMQRA